ncbi:hypothetical protein [Streptomyces sp. NBC_00690]|uniref:hypothetical protein n=1 Tax=Streptomyces sp. NBC_00690 TaxID=2975808 RepID=UPI002E2D8C12|nr:hypothetical protein [Streptomyces sp. NBC_00690]
MHLSSPLSSASRGRPAARRRSVASATLRTLTAASLAASALLMASAGPGTAAPAAPAGTSANSSALTIDAACPVGTGTVNYTPGIVLAPRQTSLSFTGSAGPCTSTDPAITAVSAYSGTGQGDLGCLSGGFDATGTILWNTGAVSNATLSSVVDLRPGGIPVIVATGPITSGKFAGSTVELVSVLLPANPLGCFTSQGITQTHGPVSLTVLH